MMSLNPALATQICAVAAVLTSGSLQKSRGAAAHSDPLCKSATPRWRGGGGGGIFGIRRPGGGGGGLTKTVGSRGGAMSDRCWSFRGA